MATVPPDDGTTLPILNLDIDESAYSGVPGNMILAARVASGPSRRRLDFIGAPAIFSVQWVLLTVEYQYLVAFFESTLNYGVLPFQTNMMVNGLIESRKCSFVEGTFTLAGKKGDAVIVTAQLEVGAAVIPPDPDTVASIAMLVDAYGADAPTILNELAQLVNVDLVQDAQ